MKITNAVLAERINNSHNDVKELKECIQREIVPEVKKNTEFRQKAYGAMASIGFIFSALGGLIVWGVSKLWGSK